VTDPVHFFLDDKDVMAEAGETIWEVAKRTGTLIPHLCHRDAPGYRPDGNCRVCMVEIKGERFLAPSCLRTPLPAIQVLTQSERARKARRMVLELLLADQPPRERAHDPDSLFWRWADDAGLAASRFHTRNIPTPDRSHPAMAVHLDACIHCGLCVRACREVQVNDVIGIAGRNIRAKVVFDFDDPMGNSTCVACGECVQACPTGALMPASVVDEVGVHTARPERSDARSHTTLATTASFLSTDGTALPTAIVCASRVASASTTSAMRIA
jgi:formate dehydrogenase major subunit